MKSSPSAVSSPLRVLRVSLLAGAATLLLGACNSVGPEALRGGCSLAAGFGLQDGQRRDQVAIVTRSLMSALFFLSQAVDVEGKHEDRGLVTVTEAANGERFDWQKVLGGRVRAPLWQLPAGARGTGPVLTLPLATN